MSINPFSKNFEEDFNKLLERVAELERFADENRRTAGSLFDRLGKGGDENRQFVLFCHILSGDPTVGDAGDAGLVPNRRRMMVEPEDELPASFYVVEPAIEFYRSLFGAGINLPTADELLEKLEAPSWLKSEMQDGVFIGENCCDYRYKPQANEEGAVVQNLHGVNAPNDPAISGNFGVVNVKPLGNPTPSNGVGGVPVIFTKIRDDVHVGIYGKNDLGVSCAQASEEDAGLQARIRGARKRYLFRRSKTPEVPAESDLNQQSRTDTTENFIEPDSTDTGSRGGGY